MNRISVARSILRRSCLHHPSSIVAPSFPKISSAHKASAFASSNRPCQYQIRAEPPVLIEPFLDAIVVKDRQDNGCFPNPTRTDEVDWSEALDETNDLFDEFIPSKAGPRRRGGDSPSTLGSNVRSWVYHTIVEVSSL